MLKKLKIRKKCNNFFRKCEAFALATTCIFSSISCSSCNQSKQKKENIDTSGYCQEENIIESRDNPSNLNYNKKDNQSSYEYDSSSNSSLEKNISLDELVYIDSLSNDYIQDYIDNLEILYPYSDLYNVNQVLEKYYSLQEYNSPNLKIIKDRKVDTNELYNIVLKNNTNYLNKIKHKNYLQLSSSELRKVCRIICDNINIKLSINNIDINELEYKLKELKIFNYNSFGYGFYSQYTNILGLNLISIANLKYDYNVFESVVRHESNHIIQANSLLESENEGYDTKFGPSYRWDNLEVNSLYWNWYFEGCAESLNIEDYNKEPLTYHAEIKCLETIKTATIIDNNNELYDLENISLQSNLDMLFDYFNCKSTKDKEEIIKMFYTLNIIYQNNSESSSKDFINKYKKIYGQFNSNEYSFKLKGSIALTLSKIFYKNLFNEITNKDINVEHILKIISVFENEISRLTWYSSNYNYINNFLEKYIDIQNEAFNIIAKKSNISLEDIRYIFEKINKSSIKIDSLTNEKNDFYNYIVKTRRNDKKNTIYEVYSQIKKYAKN